MFAVADDVDIDFDGVVQKAIQQDGRVRRDVQRFFHVVGKILIVVDDVHGAAAQYVGGAHDERIPDFLRFGERFLCAGGGAVGRLQESEFVDERLEAFAVFGAVDGIGRGADDGYARFFQGARQLERGLSAVLHDDAVGLFDARDFEHVFQRQGFEVEAVGGVEVGGDGFRVAVDHDGFDAVFAQRECGVHAAVVEFDALADAVGAAS